jgi:hypothetical protein
MALGISDLIKAMTAAEVEESLLTSLETVGVSARSWRKGGVLRVIIVVVATLYAGFSTIMAAFAKAAFLDLSGGDWLTLVARYVFDVERAPATFAGGPLKLVNGGGGLYGPFNPGEVLARNPSTGKSYANAAGFTLNPAETLVVDFVAVEQGAASSADTGQIAELETVLLGVAVTNEAAIVGSDEQKDDDLKAACKAKRATRSPRGPRDTYDYHVRNALRLDGSRVDINRVYISPSSSTGIVTIVCASPSGPPIVTDLDRARESVEEHSRPDTATVNLSGATASASARTLTVWARRQAGVDAAGLSGLVSASIAAMVSEYPIGGITKPPSTQGYLYASNLEGTARIAHPSIYAVDVPGGDILISAGQVAVVSLTLDVRIVEVN